MNENAEYQMLVKKINRWFNFTSTVQIVFTMLMSLFIPLFSVISLVVLILMGNKNKNTVMLNISWYVFVFFWFLIIVIFDGSVTMGPIMIIDIALVIICIRAYRYAAENEELKKIEGYPYFFDRGNNINFYPVSHNASSPQQNGLSEKEPENTAENTDNNHLPTADNRKESGNTANAETGTVKNNEFIRVFIEMIQDIKNAIIKKPENFIDYAKITAIIIIIIGFLNLHLSSIFYSMLEFVFLIVALVYPSRKRIKVGFILHGVECLLMMLAGNVITNGVVFAFLVMLYIFQTALYYFAYRDIILIEDMKREEIKNKYEENKEEREYHPRYNLGIYKSEPENTTFNNEEYKKISLDKKRGIAMEELCIPENITPDDILRKPDMMDNTDA